MGNKKYKGGAGRNAYDRRNLQKYLAERDGTNCWLCGKEIDMDKRDGSDFAPSLDHVIPRVDGGSNHSSNLRLAHVFCNSIRRDGFKYRP